VQSNRELRIGVDLGGTKIAAVLLDPAGEIAVRHRCPTPRDDYRATLGAIKQLVGRIEAEANCTATVGVGTPGAISPATGTIKNANSVWLNGQPLDRDLCELLEREVRVANDADCFALSEATDGAAAGLQNVFGVILGTGVGGGLVVQGSLVRGPNAISGEWGHNPLPSDEETTPPACYCGRNGCIETYLSGPALARDHLDETGESLTAAEIATAADAGDAGAESTLARYEERLARALATLINVIDPDAIVLGGGLSGLTRLYKTIPERWTRYVFSDRVDTLLLPPRHGDSSGVRGAAWLWPSD